MQNKKIAIIPARSGSKGLVDKNVKLLCGKPLMAYTIEAAKESNLFDSIIVSTDNLKYAEIAEQFGAEVPFLRSSENSLDKSSSWDVVKEVILKLNTSYDTITLLQPTSPLRTSEDIKNAMILFENKNADTLFSVCETSHSGFWCNTIDNTLSAKNFIDENYRKPRQELPVTYAVNGAIYIIKAKMLDNINLYGDKSYVYIMEQSHSIDIDSSIDFKLAESILRQE